MVRIPRFRQENTHIENRIAGADTNPYLALAAILIAGLDGIVSKTPLPEMTEGNAVLANAPLLQTDLSLALHDLRNDPVLCGKLGPDFLNQYEQIRMSEYHRYQGQITKWEIDEYIDLF